MRLVDSHCHLDFPGLAERVVEVLERARAAGVVLVVTIATTRAGWDVALELAERHPEVVCALGIHPHNASREGLRDAAPLVAAARHPRVVAIGEVGLDYHYDFAAREDQLRNFRIHIEAARASGLPLVVHTRDADDDTLAVLEEEMARAPFAGEVHCYSHSLEFGRRVVELGFYLGIGGILTFRRSEPLRQAVAALPLERMVLETDAPYLAPVPHRGRTNEPAYVVETARVLARVKGVEFATVARTTTANAAALFPRTAALLGAPCG